ncbi:RNA polymerase sigma-70 factor [uncultured Bacteroides sp.]|uniref:RNA polymerase sigma-70 factor n=1 Tax=uncultured Bacteroides sp. TaxID=162156 RepID=UPI002AA8333F|nr:RNA polymerase sigma-70 factor [uncultured Bacteroides sp.]
MSESNDSYNLTLFSRFFEENQTKFLSFAYSYTRSKTVAEDILMEAMMALWDNYKLWEEDANPRKLLLTIIKNKALNYLAHQQVRMRAEENISSHSQRELSLRISTLKACEPDMIFNTEIQSIVRKALEHVPEQSKRIFLMSHFENTSNKKIAEQFGISIKSVEFHITKVLKVLRHELKDYLVSFFF